ncbi:MAG: hypothetical protein ABI921_12055 [Panacibacter sp.]
MKEYFSFNPETHDYWSIIETIKKYYPMGIEDDTWMCYNKDPSRKSLEEIIVKNIHEESEIKSIWNSLNTDVVKDLNKELIGTTYGQSPSFSAELILEKFENEKVWYRKKLCFSISLLGPFYTIYGIDETAINYPERKNYSYYKINAITTSPLEEFETPFLYLQKKIEEKWEAYKLVPFYINSMYVKGLKVPQIQQPENTVYHALFNHLLFYIDTYISVRGKDSYGYERWLVPGAKLGGWTAYPPDSQLE